VVDGRTDIIESSPNSDYWTGPGGGGPGYNPNKPGTVVVGTSSSTTETTTNLYQGFRHAAGANFAFIDGHGGYRKFDPSPLTGSLAAAPRYVQNSGVVTAGQDNFIGGYGLYRVHHFQSIIPN
jgi:prepilin-type processing-associated H-X9-DG protein